ncbi:MAG: asnB [Segetibacter sp.]|nr:asnB [Segetibacter sp.]
MTDVLQHRGPEGEGFWISEEGTVGFGHRRLSIIDLSEAGAQPMHYLNRFTITYNGEIYNYIELKEQLVKSGFAFHTHSDTEVILASYACWGKDCLTHFDGMFAFAIWDKVERTLFCARDRFGEKPFYFFHDNEQFLFSSEMKALWVAGVDKVPNNTMLLNYLTLGFTTNPAKPDHTFYKNIFKLPAAHYLELKLGEGAYLNYNYWQYWDIDKESQLTSISNKEVVENFSQLLQVSVQRRLRSDVVVGSSLSGGLDSSTIVAVINKLVGDTSKQKTFSAVFPGYEKDESSYINLVTEHFSVDSYTVTPSAEGYISDFEKLMYHQEEPFQSSSIYAQFKVYELAKQKGVTVILDGQGADETLAGYHKYYHWYWQELVAKGKWNDARKEQQAAKANGAAIDWNWKNYAAAYMPGLTTRQLEKKALHKQMQHKDLTPDFLNENLDKASLYKPTVEKLNDILYFNTRQLGLEELLRYADRNSMAHSREVRLPFLSHELVEFVFKIPSSYKIFEGFTKHLLRLSMDTLLPKAIVWRKDKIGFEPPQEQWMQHKEVIEKIDEGRRKLVAEGVLNKEVLNKPIRTKEAHQAENFDWRYLSASQTMF